MQRDKDLIPRFWFCVLFTFPFFVRTLEPAIQWLLATIILVVGNWSFFQKAWMPRISVYTFFSLSVGLLYAYSLLEGFFSDAPTFYYGMVAAVTSIILLQQILEQRYEDRALFALNKIIEKTPKTAQKLFPDGHSEEVAINTLKNGDTVRIAPGELVPVDGVIFADDALVDESLISGDSTPVQKTLGSSVYAATQCLKGSCLVQSIRVGKQSLFSQMVEIVTSALNTPSPMQLIIDKTASSIMLGVLVFSAICFFFWSLFSGLGGAVLVVSTIVIAVCPCALLLGSSLVKTITLAEGARQGIVIRSAGAIEEIAKCTMLVTNKNGTLTTGKPIIASLDPADGVTVDELLITAASLEPKSLHPYAACITEKATSANHVLIDLEEIEEVPGLGVKGKLDNTVYLIGDENLMQGIDLGYHKARAEDMRKQGYIVLFCAKGQKLLGVLVLSDPIRKDVKATLKTFKNEGFGLFCLSGDRRVTVVQLVNALGFDRFQAEAPAQQKIQTIHKLQKEGKEVLMVGDPINDSVALCQANTGIALGSRGNILQEKGPIVLLQPNLSAALRVLDLGQKASRIMKQNIVISCAYMLVVLFMAAFGSFGPAHGAFYMLLSSMVVGINSMRLIKG